MITSPFRIVFSFAIIAGIALLLLPQLNVDLLPRQKSTTLSVSFSLPGSNPAIMEQQVTSIIEGACSQLSQLKKINSVSNYNNGYVTLEFDQSANMPYKQFELASIMRQLYPSLPPNVSYPLISQGAANNSHKPPFLIYSINAPLQPYRIRQTAETIFRKTFAKMSGIAEIEVSGGENLQLVAKFNKAKCDALKVDPGEVINTIKSQFTPSYPGQLVINGQQYFLRTALPDASIRSIENLLLISASGKPVFVKDVANISIEEQEAQTYFRINGNNFIRLSIHAREGENSIVLRKKVLELMKEAVKQLPAEFEVRAEYDQTAFLESEIKKNYRRIALSLGLLVVFILVAYRNWRYLVILLSGVVASFCLTILLAALLQLDIHIYTIAGVAISISLIIDNSIVFLDYFHQWKNRKMMKPLLASSAIIATALCMIFFLPDEEKNNLADFALVIMLALGSSLVTSLMFTPGLYLFFRNTEKFKQPASSEMKQVKKAASGEWMLNKYYSFINFITRYRKTAVILLIWVFGLPVFLLPQKWEGAHWYNKMYNASIGTSKYQESIKPVVDKWLGGTLRLFLKNLNERSGYRDIEETKLFVTAALPYGSTAQQMNDVIIDFENYLAGFKGIEKYVTSINQGQYGKIEITFKKQYSNSGFPFELESQLMQRILEWDGVQWNIYGVGQGFNNVKSGDIPNFRVIMRGYNYDELEKQASILAGKLLAHDRIQKVNSDEQYAFDAKQSMEFQLNIDAMQMALHNTNRIEILSAVSDMSKPLYAAATVQLNDEFYPLVLKEEGADNFSGYNLMHHPVRLDTARIVKLAEVGKLQFKKTAASILKENRQYLRVVSFEYMGSRQFGSKYLKKKLEEMKNEMPAGYTAEWETGQWQWDAATRKYALLLLLIIGIFIIGSILFEDLRQPFLILCIIPVSFIGLFLTFAWGEFYFDQGGYASFLMLGALVANSAVLIVNDVNIARQQLKEESQYNYMVAKVSANRFRTVLLTTISTCCGLFPFILDGQDEVFWFSFAAGAIGGLLFSLFALFVFLPLLLTKRRYTNVSVNQIKNPINLKQ